ncbi:ABC-type polysaccharide/polyol phosphate export permease [Photobacterium lutimaris]|nr:ABC-type polysaccharide/polyol phosphate export permease [Photobacterium lutimaris]
MLIALYSYVVGVIFGHSGIDRILMIAIGVTLWKWWSTSLSSATTSFRRYKGIVTQVKMPLPILPSSEVFGQTYLFTFGYLLLQAVLLCLGYIPDVMALLYTMIISQITITALSLGLAILNVFVRDTAFLVGFGLRILFYITPIIYSRERVPENYQILVDLNPFAHLIEYFNNALIFTDKVNYSTMTLALVFSICALTSLIALCKKISPAIVRNV